MWKNEYAESGHLSIFTVLKYLMMLFEVQFKKKIQGFIFTPYQRHWQHVGPCSSDFVKVKTLLNNAFKGSALLNLLYNIEREENDIIHNFDFRTFWGV